jgi:ribonuclease P protein component
MRRRAEFLQAQAQGQRLHTRHFGVILAAAPAGAPRLGLAVTRRLGRAVSRNRVKRLLREFFRRHKELLPPRDLVIMAKTGAAALSYRQVEEELGRVLLHREKEKTND